MSHDEETLYLTLNCVYLIAVSRANGTVLWKSRFAVRGRVSMSLLWRTFNSAICWI